MKRKTIDEMREVRLWITQLVLPAAGIGLWLDYKYPHLKYDIKRGFDRKVDEAKITLHDLKDKVKGQK